MHRYWRTRSLAMIRVILLLALAPQILFAGLERYSSLVVADAPGLVVQKDAVRVTYLGTNGYQFETAGRALLIDPYFSRISLPRAALGWPVRSDSSRVRDGLTQLAPTVDAILVTHGHFDHLLDVPAIMRTTGGRLVASQTSVELAKRAGAPADRCQAVKAGSSRQVGPWHITVFPASHDHIFLIGVPFNGTISNGGPPQTAADWVCGEPLSYLIEANGFRIFIDSGGTPAVLPPSGIAPIDLAILGVALPDARARLAAAVACLRPRYFLPSHQDDFFQPLDRGFQFGNLTDFPFVRREYERLNQPGRIILLDYFRPWMLTKK
jgi:L-ascorbate metabolism protein UlaG (beta-lactamase superfamily)